MSRKCQETAPVIELPLDHPRRGDLARKLAEYKARDARDNRYSAPEVRAPLLYRIMILEKLLEEGAVQTWDLSREIVKNMEEINARKFEEACAIIVDYIETGGKNVSGGEGFPPHNS